jgi:hypothetical protein
VLITGVGTRLRVLAGVAGPMGALAVWHGGMSAAAAPGAASGADRSAVVMPDFGNPNGHFPVPAAGRAVDTAHPDHVIGNGRAASCTSAAVVRAVAAGGVITFDCGSRPVTIVMTSTASVVKTRRLVVLDGAA